MYILGDQRDPHHIRLERGNNTSFGGNNTSFGGNNTSFGGNNTSFGGNTRQTQID